MSERPHLFDLERDALRELAASAGMAAYRADQVLQWVYRRHVADVRQMTNLARTDAEAIERSLCIVSARVEQHLAASDGVQKLLLDYGSGPEANRSVECVLIPAPPRRTACISSQFGCPVGCRFCASGLEGLGGNLTAGRIVEQVWHLAGLPGSGPISHVVFMGMGEPLANFAHVLRAVRILHAPWGLGLSARRITISTVGLPAQIRRLAELAMPLNLAISLHAPTDELRRQLIPWAEQVSIDQLVEAGRHYFERTGREVTLEYVLLHEVNDRPEQARELAAVARRLRSSVNLIRYNEVPGIAYRRPTDEAVLGFQRALRRAGVNCHIRASRGRDIAAACGQLRYQ